MQGSITECRAFIDRCNRRAQERTEPVGIAFAEGWAAPLLEYCGDGEHSSALLASSVAIGARFRLEQVRLWTAAVGGWIEARRGRTKAGVATLREAVAGVEKAGLRTWLPWVQSWFAEALLLHGEAGEAIVVTTRALESAAAMGAHFYDAELLRLRGEALQALGQREQSVTTLLEAIAAAERQGAATLAARASSALASLHGEQV